MQINSMVFQVKTHDYVKDHKSDLHSLQSLMKLVYSGRNRLPLRVWAAPHKHLERRTPTFILPSLDDSQGYGGNKVHKHYLL